MAVQFNLMPFVNPQENALIQRNVLIANHLNHAVNCHRWEITWFCNKIKDPANANWLPPNTTPRQFLQPVYDAIGTKPLHVDGHSLDRYGWMDPKVLKYVKEVVLTVGIHWDCRRQRGRVVPSYSDDNGSPILWIFRDFRSCERLIIRVSTLQKASLPIWGQFVIRDWDYAKVTTFLAASIMGFDLDGNRVGHPRVNPVPLSKVTVVVSNEEASRIVSPYYDHVNGWVPNGNGWDDSKAPPGIPVLPHWALLNKYFGGEFVAGAHPDVDPRVHFPLTLHRVRPVANTGDTELLFNEPNYAH